MTAADDDRTPARRATDARNLEEHRTTAIALLFTIILGAVILRDRGRPQVEAGGEVVQLPVGSRVRWRAHDAAAA